MSDLVYQNYNNRCQGWTNPSNLLFGIPQITVLSSFQSPAGSNTLVSVNGTNFFSYSTIRFGTFSPTTYFINSNLLQFYVPNTLSSGTFPVQVFNGSVPSNSVNYTIDNASGYWLLNSNGSISNTNLQQTSIVNINSLSRNIPHTITGSSFNFNNLTQTPNPNNINWVICNYSGTITITLPSGSSYTGREIMFKNISTGTGQVISSTSNISSIDGTTTNTSILFGVAGSWATLVFDGSNWITMQAN